MEEPFDAVGVGDAFGNEAFALAVAPAAILITYRRHMQHAAHMRLAASVGQKHPYQLVEIEPMAALHVHFMNEPGPTDVLAFPMDELGDQRDDTDGDDVPPTLLGDVVLCPEVAAAQAEQAGHSLEDELHLLCTHGILHLLGYDHGDAEEEREMFGLQGQLLTRWTKAR